MTATGEQFHSAAKLAKSIVIGQQNSWSASSGTMREYDLQHVKEELADVIVYSQNLLDKLGLDADEIVRYEDGDERGEIIRWRRRRGSRRSMIACERV